MVYTCTIETPLGNMTASANKIALTGLWFLGQKYYPTDTDAWIYEPSHPIFVELRRWLAKYFEGNNGRFEIELQPQGTPFQKSVWDILIEIPYGQIITYGEIAKKLAASKGLSTMSSQAVGGAVGHNPISIIIPCHRVVGSDRSLTGYAGGIDKKSALLSLEHAIYSI